MYGNLTKATKASDCLPCPENTFNHLKGTEACKPCGSSAFAPEGSNTCTCKGLYRSFQVSDGACVCESGYVYYDVVDVQLEEGNSDKSCQPKVGLTSWMQKVNLFQANIRFLYPLKTPKVF